MNMMTNLRQKEPTTGLLAEYEKNHADLLNAMAVMASAADAPVADRHLYSNARWRLSQASLKRRMLWGRIYRHLAPRAGPHDAAALDRIQATDVALQQQSAAHVGKWTTDAIEADWAGYCDASRTIRWKMNAHMDAERRVVYPLLAAEALGEKRQLRAS
jgi:hypothetical protein